MKQVIIIRKDLKMRKGKIAAQAAHASMKVFFDRIWHVGPSESSSPYEAKMLLTEEMKSWVEGSFTKICVSVDSEEELLSVYKAAQDAQIPCSLIEDEGRTEFNGIKTKTAVAIGPGTYEDLNRITGGLPLL
jgi:peptidyl-tRNA hydrolase, PTH2 family